MRGQSRGSYRSGAPESCEPGEWDPGNQDGVVQGSRKSGKSRPGRTLGGSLRDVLLTGQIQSLGGQVMTSQGKREKRGPRIGH